MFQLTDKSVVAPLARDTEGSVAVAIVAATGYADEADTVANLDQGALAVVLETIPVDLSKNRSRQNLSFNELLH